MDKFPVAKIGKTVGLHGQCKLHLMSDFAQQFQPGATFESERGKLQIKSYNRSRDLVCFVGYESIDSAKKLTNSHLYSDKQKTREMCTLQEGEMFWFDMIGLPIIDGDKRLGVVKDIDRIAGIEYFKIETDPQYAEISKRFLIPNIEQYIVKKTDTAIYTQNCFGLLEQS